MDARNMPLLGHNLNVVSSTDPTLVGRNGAVVSETMRTIVIEQQGRRSRLAKDVIRFTIDDSDAVIDGSHIGQRPEDRIHRRYRK